MSRLVGESRGSGSGRALAIAAAASLALATACSSSASSPNTAAKPAAHEVVDGQQHSLRELARMCLGLQKAKVYGVEDHGHHTTQVNFEDGPVPPTRDERSCTVEEKRIGGHLVPVSVSVGQADGLHATLSETFTHGGHADMITSTMDRSAAGGSDVFSVAGINSLSNGPEFPTVTVAIGRDLREATVVPAGA